MNTRLGNQTVLGGIVAVLAIAILLGAKATLAAIATAVALLVLLMVLQGVRIARQEFSSRQPTDAILTVASYSAGVLVLAVGLFEVVVTRGPAKAGRMSSQLGEPGSNGASLMLPSLPRRISSTVFPAFGLAINSSPTQTARSLARIKARRTITPAI